MNKVKEKYHKAMFKIYSKLADVCKGLKEYFMEKCFDHFFKYD